ncbi:MAG: hypothetical protein HZB91_09580 [Elusimicrobia bacterium]|nr:hypothetical protein [Elusimicrobiota bacterium]
MMKTLRHALPIIILLPMCGCLTMEGYSLTLDWKKLSGEIVYHDIGSDGDAVKEYAELKDMLADQDVPFKVERTSDTLQVTGKELFREGDHLSGRVRFKLLCPEGNCDKAGVLSKILDCGTDCWSRREEVILFMDDADTVRSNGKVLRSKKNRIVVWPLEAEVFTLESRGMDESCGRGKKCRSLLPYWAESLQY